MKIYKDALKYESKLSWFIEKIINERTVKLNNNNIYKDGIEGIFEDINTKCDLPEKLYLANSFNLKFSPSGTINSLYTLVYGKSKNGKDESFLITYDKSKSEDIYIHLNGSVNTDYSNDKLMQPLFDTVKNISIKDTVSNWNEDLYGILYYGKRNLGYNAEGVVNIDNNGNEISIETTYSEIIGYIVSVFVPDKEKEITPIRYNNISLQSIDNKLDTSSKNEDNYISLNSKEEFYLSKEVGYKLEGVDKVAGSTLYVLNKTTDSGLTWELINDNPFGNVVGNVSGITFIDENIGFLVSGNVSETEGILYRTEDAGKSFKIITYATDIEYFDFPGLPYEENGELCMLVGQASDGDYNVKSSVLYKSKDKGITWEYIEEVKKKN